MSLVVHQLLDAVQDSELEVRHLARIVEQDAGLLGRLVGLANAPYYGYPEVVTTAEDAIFKVLGLHTARNIALGIILSGPFDASRCRSFRLERYWASAMTVAILAQRFAPYVTADERVPPGEAYLCGLLHSIGSLALVHLYPSAMEQVFAEPADTPEALLEREKQVLGTTHCEVGGWLARKWHLPRPVVAVLEHHLDPAYRGEHWVTLRLVGEAVRWTAALDGDKAASPAFEELGIAKEQSERVLETVMLKREEILALSRGLAHG